MPVGIKDIIDTAGVPTGNGTVLDEGRVPDVDAFLVQRLKRAGAVILGKTVSTELAFLEPSKTRHPVDQQRTPGGSSSGSAAAVACDMVPLSVGTQTGGSVIRPATFCGVTGFKPSFGSVARTGVLNQSHTLDTIGVFGKSVIDVAMLAECLFGHDTADPSSSIAARPELLAAAVSERVKPPSIAFVKTPFWSSAETAMQRILEKLATDLGQQCSQAALPDFFADALPIRALINQVEMAKNLAHYKQRGVERLSMATRQFMAEGEQVFATDYLGALDWREKLNDGLEDIFTSYDVIMTPATTGAAPGIETTGDPVFNGLWTLCGTPAITLPLCVDQQGMPLGVQLVGKRNNDAQLLSVARWLEAHISLSGFTFL